jgi:copper resistance protein C
MLRTRAYRALAVTAFAGALARPGVADAHAIILEAEPAMNDAVAGPDVQIRLRFNSRIDHKRSRLTLVDPAGETRPLVIDKAAAEDMLAARAASLVPGAYRIRWQVLAVDGHITRGDVPFTVARP